MSFSQLPLFLRINDEPSLHDPERVTLSSRDRRRRSGRPVDELLPETKGYCTSCHRKEPGRACLAQRTVGQFLLSDAELAMHASRVSLCRTRPAWIHGEE